MWFRREVCIKWDEGYYPNENGACSLATNCKISYKGQFIECKENYIILGSDNKYQTCKSILSNDYLNVKKLIHQTVNVYYVKKIIF